MSEDDSYIEKLIDSSKKRNELQEEILTPDSLAIDNRGKLTIKVSPDALANKDKEGMKVKESP